jgi:hypothetical protein
MKKYKFQNRIQKNLNLVYLCNGTLSCISGPLPSNRVSHKYTECQPSLLSSRLNWVPTPPHPQEVFLPPFFGSKVGDTLARGEGGGGPNSDGGTDILVL